MPYLHLPLQSGSDKILKAMNRRHNSSQYLEIIEKLQNANPNLRFASDFIVGFPGETDQDFEATLKIAKQINYIQSFSFKYSRRPGTPAAVFSNQIEEKVKQQRLTVLQEELFAMQLKFNQSCVGQTMPVLFESKGKQKGEIFGRTPYMQTLVAKGDATTLNQIKNVTITSGGMNSLSGTIK